MRAYLNIIRSVSTIIIQLLHLADPQSPNYDNGILMIAGTVEILIIAGLQLRAHLQCM